VKEQILNYYTPIKQKTRHKLIVKKKSFWKKKVYLLFPVLIVLLIVGYLIYKENNQKLQLAEKVKEISSIKKIGTKSEMEKSEKLLPIIIVKAKLQLESLNNTDTLKVIIEGKDADKRDIKYNYEWFKNSESFGSNADSITGFKKGDKIDVKVTPFVDDEQIGQPKILSIEIARVPPKIIENKEVVFDGKLLSYQVKAISPDGGPLKYSLIDPPKGMTINNETGMINWPVQSEDNGKRDIKVRISDDSGSEIIYSLSIDVGKVAE
jgi:hypothetical protein